MERFQCWCSRASREKRGKFNSMCCVITVHLLERETSWETAEIVLSRRHLTSDTETRTRGEVHLYLYVWSRYTFKHSITGLQQTVISFVINLPIMFMNNQLMVQLKIFHEFCEKNIHRSPKWRLQSASFNPADRPAPEDASFTVTNDKDEQPELANVWLCWVSFNSCFNSCKYITK